MAVLERSDFKEQLLSAMEANVEGKPVLLVMSGVSGAGKSTILKENSSLLESLGFKVLDVRDIQMSLWKQNMGEEKLHFFDTEYKKYYDMAEKEMGKQVEGLLKEGTSVVVDSAYNTRIKREKMYRRGIQSGAFVACCACRAEYSIAMARNVMRGDEAVLQGRIYSMCQSVQYPSKEHAEAHDIVLNLAM